MCVVCLAAKCIQTSYHINNFKSYYNATIGGEDYVPGSFNVTIAAGDIRSVVLDIAIIDDDIFERNESFSLNIDSSSLPSRVLVPPDCISVITIEDDDDGELLFAYVRTYICRETCMYYVYGQICKRCFYITFVRDTFYYHSTYTYICTKLPFINLDLCLFE